MPSSAVGRGSYHVDGAPPDQGVIYIYRRWSTLDHLFCNIRTEVPIDGEEVMCNLYSGKCIA